MAKPYAGIRQCAKGSGKQKRRIKFTANRPHSNRARKPKTNEEIRGMQAAFMASYTSKRIKIGG